MKSKELALVEAEKKLSSALERALMVDDLQNQNTELRRQVGLCLVWLVALDFTWNTLNLQA